MVERKNPQRERAASQFRRWMAATNAAEVVLDPFKREHYGKVSVSIIDERDGTYRDTAVSVNLKKAHSDTVHEIWSSQGDSHLSLVQLGLPYMRGPDTVPFDDSVYARYAQSWLDTEVALAERRRRNASSQIDLVQFIPVLNVIRDFSDARTIDKRNTAEERKWKRRVEDANATLERISAEAALDEAAVPFAPELRAALGKVLGERDTVFGRDAQEGLLHMILPDSPAESRPPTRRSGMGARVVDREKGTRYSGPLGVIERIVRH